VIVSSSIQLWRSSSAHGGRRKSLQIRVPNWSFDEDPRALWEERADIQFFLHKQRHHTITIQANKTAILQTPREQPTPISYRMFPRASRDIRTFSRTSAPAVSSFRVLVVYV